MGDIGELRDPHRGDFYQPMTGNSITAPDTELFIGKRALEAIFYTETNGLSEDKEIRRKYSREFLTYISEDEIPFRRVHLTRETLNIAVTSLGHRRNDRDGADRCLTTVVKSDVFQIHHCSSVEYDRVVQSFLEYDPRTISIQEAVLAIIAREMGISHLLTWDSDFTRYDDDLVLYPRNYWE